MLTRIIVYYYDPLRAQLKNFLFSHVIKEYMENNDTVIVENHHSEHGWHLILQDNNNNITDINCLIFSPNTIRGYRADIFYLQEYLYEHEDKNSLDYLNSCRYANGAPIYIFDDEGVIGEWNIN